MGGLAPGLGAGGAFAGMSGGGGQGYRTDELIQIIEQIG